MTPEEVAVYYDDPAHAKSMCDLLMRAFPGWAVWRANRLWHARYETWPACVEIRNDNAGLLNRAIRMGGVEA